MYGSIQICAVGSKRRIFSAKECVLVVQGGSWSSKVDDFGTNRKRVCDLLLYYSVIVTMVLSCTVSEIYGDLLAKNCPLFIPLSHSAPSLPMFPLEFRGKVTIKKLESWGYPPVKTA